MSRDRGALAPFPAVAFPVAALACLAYAQTLGYGFAGDDIEVIRDRVLFHDLHRWREIVTSPWWSHALYRPVTALTLAANWVLGGGDPRVFHLVNVLLHGITALLVFQLARAFVGPAAALAAGLVFAVHPVHVEAVTNLVGRAEVLSTLFVLLAVLLYQWDGRLADAAEHLSVRRYAASLGTLVATGLALGSKESAFALPGLLLLVDWFDGHARGLRLGPAIGRHWLLWAAVVTTCIGWLLLRAHVVQDLTGLEVAPGLEYEGLGGRTIIMLPIVLQYVRLLFLPVRLSAEYSPNFIVPAGSLGPAGILGAGLVIGSVAVGLLARRQAPAVTLSLGWIGATLLIVSNILVPTGILLAERTLYMPSVGAALLIAWAWQRVYQRGPGLALAGLVCVVAAGTLRIVTRNPIWRDDRTYYPAMVRDAPGSFRTYWVAAELARQQGDFGRSERLLRQTVQTHPLAWAAWRDLGKLMYYEGRYPDAAQAFWAAWRITSGSSFDAQRAIQSWLQAGQIDSAESWLARAQAARSNEPLELILAGSDVALARGRYVRAMTLRRQAAWRFPDSTRFWALTGDAAVRAHHCPGVLEALEHLRTRPDTSGLARDLEIKAHRLQCT